MCLSRERTIHVPEFRRRSYNSVFMLLGIFMLIGVFTNVGDLKEAAVSALKLIPERVSDGEVWRLFTYAFLTAGAIELLFKVLVFFFIAAPLEARWGTRRFLTIFGISVVVGGLTATAVGVELSGGWGPTMALMLIHGFLFPNSTLYLFFVIPVRVKTLAIIFSALFLITCVTMGLQGLALFLGMFSGVAYYMIVTRSIPWARKTVRKASSGALKPTNVVKEISTARMMAHAKKIMRECEKGKPLSDEDRIYIEELLRHSDAAMALCSPYSFRPDNEICPPCREFGRCLKRWLETQDEEPVEV